MKPNPIAIAMLSVVLTACSAQQAPAPSVPTAESPAATPAPAASATMASQETAMGKRAAGDATPPMTIFRAFGNEPFWHVNVEDATLTFTTPEDQQGKVMQGERRSLADGVEITGNHDGKPFALRVTAGICSDGMSENRYQLVSTFRHGEVDYKGCGEAAK